LPLHAFLYFLFLRRKIYHMPEYIVSARKYRPETFAAVAGQDTITVTLKNAIRNKHLGHAYLFCGPRGVGKTTCARIFAKTINCSDITSEVEPCNSCESCISFNENRTFNIHELDAASNNSVDDIRNLTDQVRIPPQVGRYSIYIIDEVHMLSAQAFNAFLKTLEEPPLHAIFILATTEKHKIIPTILSRCQIFDFNRIQISDITGYLEKIAKSESVEYEQDALTIIARKADGAMRDALSIFDQIVSFSGGVLRYADVINNLNVLDYEYYFSITQAILNNDISGILTIYNEIQFRGFDGHNFISGLSCHFRDLLVSRDEATLELLDTSAGIKERYIRQTSLCPLDFLYRALELSSQADLTYKSSKNQRLHVELYLIRLANLNADKQNFSGVNEPLKESIPKSASPDTGKIAHDADTAGQVSQVLPINETRVDLVQEPKTNLATKSDTASKPAPNYTGPEKSPSIKSALIHISRDKETDADKELEAIQRKSEFTTEQLHECWLQYAETIGKEKPRMFTFLKNHLPELKDEFNIVVNFNNSAQLDEFITEIKKDLTEYLINGLDNNIFMIMPELPEEAADGKQLYTQEEKYKYLRKKNPLIDQLKKEINLDFE